MNPNKGETACEPEGEKFKEKLKQNQSKAKKVKEQERDKDRDKEVKELWLFTTLKGHTGSISSMDYSKNGKYLATCADDRTVLLWDVREVVEKERRSCKSFRVNLDGDSADLVCWSPDSRAFVVHRAMDNLCQVHRVEKKDGGGFVTMTTKSFGSSESNIIALSIAPDGKFILTASSNNVLILWDLKGPTEINRLDTGLKDTSFVMISPCGQFIVACGTDAVVWLTARKDGGLQKVFDLKDVCHLSFDQNGTKLASISPVGEWKLYDIPPQIHSRLPIQQASGKISTGCAASKTALSPQGETLGIASRNMIAFYKVYRPNEPAELHRTISIGGTAQQLLFDPQGKYLFAALGDRHIKVFINVTKYVCELEMANTKLKEPQTSATRERLIKLAQECKMRLSQLCPQ